VTTILWSALAAGDAMGQQRYEQEVLAALRAIGDPTFDVRPVTFRSLRSSLPGNRRFPLGVAARAPDPLGRALGLALYGPPRRGVLVHRLDLRVPPAAGREVLTIHDLAPLRFPDEGVLPRWSEAGARRAAAVIAPSEFSADELRQRLGVRRVHVVPYGVSPPYGDAPALDDGELEALGVRPPFVLHAGGASQRKNLDALAGAWSQVAADVPDHSLVLSGPPHPNRTTLFSGLPRTALLGRVPTPVVAGLMARAEAVVVPSRYEGFGLPVLEAMRCGTPVVAARAGSLPEVCGDAAVLVEPDADGIAAGLAELLADEGLRLRLVERGREWSAAFTWDRVAEAHLDVYRQVVA
jgi:glycosyltransferase involved in cell wall biosynthesis